MLSVRINLVLPKYLSILQISRDKQIFELNMLPSTNTCLYVLPKYLYILQISRDKEIFELI